MMIRRILILMIAVIGMFGSDAFAVYDTNTGRFMQRDPIGYKGGGNLYAYVGGSPTVGLDPYGLFTVNFSPNVSGPDQARINAALNKACKAASDANKALDGVSQCAADKLGEDFKSARAKLKTIEKGCNSSQSLNIGNQPQPPNSGHYWDRRPILGPGVYGPPEFNPTIELDIDNDPDLTPAELVLHELVHYAEDLSADRKNRDDTSRHDDGMDLEDIAGPDGFSGSPLGKAVAEAEKCCSDED